MIIIDNTLEFKLYKNNNLKINKNSIAYSKKNDKILFELDSENYSIFLSKDKFNIIKEDSISIFRKSNDNASIYLKEYDLQLDLIIEEMFFSNEDSKCIIKYQLDTDDEQTTIEIIY